MAGIFDKECFAEYVASIEAYEWGGDGLTVPDLYPLGPDWDWPPPPPIYDGCICPTTAVVMRGFGNTRHGSLGFSVSAKDGDCCDNLFVIDYEPPCALDIQTSGRLSGIFKSVGGTHNLITVGNNTDCTLGIISEINFPCPTTMSTGSDRNSNTWNTRHGSGRISITRARDCDFALALDLCWPCPVLISNLPTVNIFEPEQKIGSAQLVISSVQSSCEWGLGLNINWPCPVTVKSSSQSSTNARQWNSRDGNVDIKLVSTSSCTWDLRVDADWPCPTKLDNVVVTSTRNWAAREGTITGAFVSVASSCEWSLGLNVNWPCPPVIATPSASMVMNYPAGPLLPDPILPAEALFYGTRRGVASLVVNRDTNIESNACNFDLGLVVDWPCPPVINTSTINKYTYNGETVTFHNDWEHHSPNWGEPMVPPNRQTGIAVLGVTEASCEFDIGMQIVWPCPPIVRATVNNTYAWNSSSIVHQPRSTWVTPTTNARLGDLQVIVNEVNCEFALDLGIQWPCPPAFVAGTVNPIYFSVGKSGSAGISIVSTSSCQFEPVLNIAWPCPVTITNPPEMNRVWMASKEPNFGQIDTEFDPDTCSFNLGLNLEFPCPTTIKSKSIRVTTNWNNIAEGDISSSEPDSSCDLTIDANINIPCTTIDLQLEYAQAAVGATPSWTKNPASPTQGANCAWAQTWTLNLPPIAAPSGDYTFNFISSNLAPGVTKSVFLHSVAWNNGTKTLTFYTASAVGGSSDPMSCRGFEITGGAGNTYSAAGTTLKVRECAYTGATALFCPGQPVMACLVGEEWIIAGVHFGIYA